MDQTPNLSLPYLLSGQAQKHVTVNEALRRLDTLVNISAISATTAEAPATPAPGDIYLVAPGASGIWAGEDNRIAAFQDGAWAFIVPRTGWRAWVTDTSAFVVWSGETWTTLFGVHAETGGIAFPASGITLGGETGIVLSHRADGGGDANAAFLMTCLAFPEVNLPASDRPNVVWRLGYNTAPGGGALDTDEPALSLVYESYYRQNGLADTDCFEFHLSMMDTDSVEHRPLTFQLPRGGVSGDTAASCSIQVDKLTLATFGGMAAVHWNLLSEGHLQVFHDLATTYFFNTNNAPVIRQRNAAGTDYVFYPYIDHADRLQLRTPLVQFADAPDAIYNALAYLKAATASAGTRLLDVSHSGSVDGLVFAATFSGNASDGFVLDVGNYGAGDAVLQAGAGTGNPLVRLVRRGGATWCVGVDASDDDSFKIARSGTLAGEAELRIDGDTHTLQLLGPLELARFATADAPTPLAPGLAVFITDGDSGDPCLAVSDGSAWRRIVLGPAISTT